MKQGIGEAPVLTIPSHRHLYDGKKRLENESFVSLIEKVMGHRLNLGK